ncbi:LexA family transcriptional regulator [Adhaeribacter sp. BT258]|uniref:LexA family transcriptional regulator n=1 Tax=Adhaeribacter terrigena TaxID=2793070 RepID=A0ABS1BZK1_9BACT|nr:LexA family transcriptional regulator [Adhaeribacter terrigena]MBK0402597.1 LexA family transcriptional regulator [Adhaeribacter terrigena]
MSFIGKNIKKIRTVRNLSQAGFAQLFNLARPSVGAYEEGRSEPKMETVVQIARQFGLSIDLLLTKELTVNELYGFDIYKQELKQAPSLKKIANPTPAPETVLIKAAQTLEYIVNRHEKKFIESLPVVHFPVDLKNIGRAFEQPGSEMQYLETGIFPGDLLLGELVEPENYCDVIPGKVYVVVLQSSLLIRRLAEVVSGETLQFKADNPEYNLVTLPVKEVLEIWEVRGVFSSRLKAPALVEERLIVLEQVVQQLNDRIKALEK